VSGACAADYRCLRQCECKTVQDKACVFPFSYKGVTYNNCTNTGSDNGAAWCATQVDAEGEVVKNTWQDCQDGCPGTNFECNEGVLFNVDGECINGTSAPTVLERIRTGPLKVILDDALSETSMKVAPICPLGRKSSEMKGCKCSDETLTKGLDGNPRGGCVPPLTDHGVEELEHGWCFLDNVQDPSDPTQDCFGDTQFSVADGRFWSNEACNVVKSIPEVCLSTSSNPCIFPFTYQGESYTSCTNTGSENGAAWCAVQVDEEGEVVKNAWEDCKAGCPGTNKTAVIEA